MTTQTDRSAKTALIFSVSGQDGACLTKRLYRATAERAA